MSSRQGTAWTVAVLLAGCGGGGDGAAGGSTLGATGGSIQGTSATPAPGAADPSSVSGSNGLQLGANAGAGGALFYNDRPLAGEPTVSGLVVVLDGRTAPPRNDPPADTVVTLNGVPLVHAVLGGAASPRYFTVDPAGPQPTLGADGFLHLVASSASAGATRVLSLACPPVPAVTPSPAAGTSLSSSGAVTLRWSTPLPAGTVPASFGVAAPQATLRGFDPATGAAAAPLSAVSLAPGALEAVLPLAPTAAPGLQAELRYAGAFLVDGETGGACGRTVRVAYSR